MLLLFFIIPLSMRAKFLLLFGGLVTLFGIIFPTGQYRPRRPPGRHADRYCLRPLCH